MVLVSLHYLWVIHRCTLGEQLRVIDVRRWRPVPSVWQLLRNHVDEVVGNLPLLAHAETDFALDLGVDSLVEPHNNVAPGFPLEASLPCDDIVGIDLLSPESLDTTCNPRYPNRLPAESFVFCVEDACILEAQKQILVVRN